MNTLACLLPRAVSNYLSATNTGDPAAFIACFAPGAEVDDAGRVFSGIDAIRSWSEREIFAVNVMLEALEAVERDGKTVVRTIVDGDFDKTGLPDPVIIDHHFALEGDRIGRLTCRLVGSQRGGS